jgi:hypothetical protein
MLTYLIAGESNFVGDITGEHLTWQVPCIIQAPFLDQLGANGVDRQRSKSTSDCTASSSFIFNRGNQRPELNNGIQAITSGEYSDTGCLIKSIAVNLVSE